MKLYKASWERMGIGGTLNCFEYIVANNFSEVSKKLPQATNIEVVQNDITVIQLLNQSQTLLSSSGERLI